MVVRTSDGQVRRLVEGRGDEYVPPFPEARAMESVGQVRDWLNQPVGPEVTEAHLLGRLVWVYRGDALTVTADQQTGYVLYVASTGIRGLMTLTALEFGLVPADPQLLSCDAI